MKHRHLTHESFTLAAIDDIIERGQMVDWVDLIKEIEADPFGDIAEKTLKICEHHQVYGSTKYFQNLVAISRKSENTPTSKMTTKFQ